MNLRALAEPFAITAAAMLASMLIFGAFMAAAGVNPFELYHWMYVGGFGTSFSWQNTLTRAAPLILTALCTALPTRLGLIIIGGEGALVLGGLAAVTAGNMLHNASPIMALTGMAVAGFVAGGIVIAIAGGLRHYRGVNATISSLLLTYISIAIFSFLVEGPLRDPASLNKPSTYPIPKEFMLGNMFGMDVHWGLAFSVVACVVSYVLMYHTTFGFAATMTGGNVRAAQGAGLPVGRLVLITCLLAGGCAGLAGMVEIAAIHGQANASMIAGYGYTGILVSFIARHHPLGIMPAAILFGGLSASSGLLQRKLNIPDASVQVLMGLIFVMILLFETGYGRYKMFMARELREALTT